MTPDPEPPDLPDVPVVEAVAADQVAAHATETPGHHAPLHTHCENCGTKLEGPFCHKCGQHDFDFKQGFGHALHDALENFFHFDTKLFRNTITLLFRPGVLSAEFNAGHRVVQMPPLRLYIFVSILFFFVEFATPQAREGIVHTDPSDLARQEVRIGAGEGLKNALAAEKAAKPDEPKSALETILEEKGRFVYDHQHEVSEAFIHAIPKMLLFCLPFFALYTRVLFRKSGLAYLQHFVVAVHFHTFIFLWIMVRNGWAWLADFAVHGLQGWVMFGGGLWLTLYPFIMLRRLFGNSWKRTIFKVVVLTFAYSGTLALAFAAAGLIILATL